jgi:hypothetical protein
MLVVDNGFPPKIKEEGFLKEKREMRMMSSV